MTQRAIRKMQRNHVAITCLHVTASSNTRALAVSSPSLQGQVLQKEKEEELVELPLPTLHPWNTDNTPLMVPPAILKDSKSTIDGFLCVDYLRLPKGFEYIHCHIMGTRRSKGL